MNPALSDDNVRWLRLRAQLLDPQREQAASAAQVVQELCGLQAQEQPAAILSARPRSRGLLAQDVERARLHDRSIVRTWCQRGTLHLLAADDLGWLLALFGPVFVAKSQRRRAQLGLDDETYTRALGHVRDILAERGPLTRAALFEQLATHTIRLEGQARPHLLGRAALEGQLCFGPDQGAEPTYVLLSDWLKQKPTGLSEASAYAELTLRYLRAYGPATPQDQAAWSGLPMAPTRAAWGQLADQLIEIEIGGAPAWMLKSRAGWLGEPPAPGPSVRLLPRFDTYLLGYQDRDLVVPPQHAKRINAGGGMVHAALLVDGSAAGTWTSERKRDRLDIAVEMFKNQESRTKNNEPAQNSEPTLNKETCRAGPPSPPLAENREPTAERRNGGRGGNAKASAERWEDEIGKGIEAEVQDIGQFLGVRASLVRAVQ